MYAMNRTNQIGLQFYIVELPDEKTSIRTEGKTIIVDAPIEKISSGWYEWQMQGKFIQDAFPFLTPSEREFLKTGITPAEWDLMFPKEKEDA